MFKLDQASEKSILNMLLDNKLINKEQINRINSVSLEGGKSKIETVLELDFTSENKILEVLSKSYSLPIVELKNYLLDEKEIVFDKTYTNKEIKLHRKDEKPKILRIYYPKHCLS